MTSPVSFSLAERVRQLREELCWTQGELAAKIPGVSQQSIDQLERGLVRHPRYLPELAVVFGVSEIWLRSGKGRRTAPRQSRDDIDRDLLSDVIAVVDRILQSYKLRFTSSQKAHLISSIYELAAQDFDKRPLEQIAQAAEHMVRYERSRQRG